MVPSVVLAATLGLMAGADDGKPSFEFALKRQGDTITAETDGKRVMFVVTSKSGIGSAAIKLKKGDWPAGVVFRLQYAAGRGFRSLESVTLSTDRLRVSGSLKQSGKMEFHFLNRAGKVEDKSPPAGILAVKVEDRQGAIEVELPANLLSGAGEIQLSWIDAYRQ